MAAIPFVFICLFLCVTSPLSGQERKYISRELEYEKLLKNMDFWVNSPMVLNDEIIFFYKGYARKVVLAGDINGWKPELLMVQTNTNFWEYSWTERLKKGVYRYKLVVDDIWTFDYNNTNFMLDESGQKVSWFELKEDFIPNARYPLWLEKDVYLFRYEARAARNISLVGDFNNWNPYSHRMVNKGGGEYELKVRLKPGLHVYCFIVDDEWVADYNNLQQYRDNVGTIVSVLHVRDRK